MHGQGLLNKAINSLPFELHIPGYQYCGPGTKLKKRLVRGDAGKNPLDEACMQHDITYSESDDLARRHEADKILQEKAWQRVKAKDSTFGEKIAAWTVTNGMKIKRKLGMGQRKGPKKSRRPPPNKKSKIPKIKRVKKSRVLPTPKHGGFLPALLPLLPLIGKALFTGALSGAAAYGTKKALGGGQVKKSRVPPTPKPAYGTTKALGGGLYLKPYKKGNGYLKNYRTGR